MKKKNLKKDHSKLFIVFALLIYGTVSGKIVDMNFWLFIFLVIFIFLWLK